MVTINKNGSLFQTGIRDLPSYHLHHHHKNFFEKNSKISNFFCYHVFDGYKTIKINISHFNYLHPYSYHPDNLRYLFS